MNLSCTRKLLDVHSCSRVGNRLLLLHKRHDHNTGNNINNNNSSNNIINNNINDDDDDDDNNNNNNNNNNDSNNNSNFPVVTRQSHRAADLNVRQLVTSDVRDEAEMINEWKRAQEERRMDGVMDGWSDGWMTKGQIPTCSPWPSAWNQGRPSWRPWLQTGCSPGLYWSPFTIIKSH